MAKHGQRQATPLQWFTVCLRARAALCLFDNSAGMAIEHAARAVPIARRITEVIS
jgi:hypothetical protein